jgi:hypothetical protein
VGRINISNAKGMPKAQSQITASLEIGETINLNLVRAALEKMGVVLSFDGVQYRALETDWVGSFSAGNPAALENSGSPQ